MVDIEIPIIGSVVNHTTLFSAVEFPETVRTDNNLPVPAYLFDTFAQVKLEKNQIGKPI